jgi:rare lipoprotein A
LLKRAFIVSGLILWLPFTVQAKAARKNQQSHQNTIVLPLVGVASFYGNKFHGRRTANGEIFNNTALTAAHRSLPFGTRVKVTSLRSGLSVEVRINDRGPFIEGRIIDLSRAAAKKIFLAHSGTQRVKLEILR